MQALETIVIIKFKSNLESFSPFSSLSLSLSPQTIDLPCPFPLRATIFLATIPPPPPPPPFFVFLKLVLNCVEYIHQCIYSCVRVPVSVYELRIVFLDKISRCKNTSSFFISIDIFVVIIIK